MKRKASFVKEALEEMIRFELLFYSAYFNGCYFSIGNN